MKRIVILTTLVWVMASFAAGGKGSSPPKKDPAAPVVNRLQTTWDGIDSYEAKFHQVVTSMGSKDESDGTLYVVKPNKLRWESKTDGAIQILNGKRLINIQENKRRQTRNVDIYEDASKSVDARSLSFLSGKTPFRKLYNISLEKNSDKSATLRLVPKSKGGEGETYLAEIEKPSYLLRSLTTDSPDSQVKIEFSDIKRNTDISDKLFEYKADPKDIVRRQ